MSEADRGALYISIDRGTRTDRGAWAQVGLSYARCMMTEDTEGMRIQSMTGDWAGCSVSVVEGPEKRCSPYGRHGSAHA